MRRVGNPLQPTPAGLHFGLHCHNYCAALAVNPNPRLASLIVTNHGGSLSTSKLKHPKSGQKRLILHETKEAKSKNTFKNEII